MRFAQPHFLWLLLVFPPGLVLFYWWAWRQRQQLMQQFIQARLLANLTIGLSPARQKVRMGSLIAAVVFLILALARPQWGYTWEEAKQRGLDIVVAIDTSKSMLARDIAPNRLVRAKLATLDLLRLAKSDRLGLVAFAGTAFLQCPLTIDETSFRQSLDALDVNLIPQGGTALAEAIDTALAAFKEEDNYKVLVMLTDGEDHDSGALEAAERAAQAGMRIFTVGIGTAEGELLRIQDARGQEDYVRDEQGNVVKSRLQETLLQQIAGATDGGFYLPLRGAKVMETFYERGLAPLPKSEGGEKLVRRHHDRYHWPLALAVVLLAFEMVWPETRRLGTRAGKARPPAGFLPQERESRAPSSDAVARVALFVVLVSWPCMTTASPSGALREYEAGRYGDALRAYQDALQRAGDDPRLRFNAGVAAYRDGQFEEAARQFGRATTAMDLQLQQQAFYNLGNTLYRAGEGAADAQQAQATWTQALQQYQNALKLNPEDTDAKFNLEFVKQRIEELKQQQQQQQSQPQDPKDPQQDQPQQQNDSSGQDPQQEQENQQQQQDAPQQQQPQDASQQPNEQPDEPQPPQSPGQQKDDEQPEAPKDEPSQVAPGQMTPEEARRLLDAQKGEEQVLPFRPEGKPKDASRPFKDW